MNVNKTYMIIGGVLGFLGVAIGAFGAHSLRPYIQPEKLTTYHTGVLYHLIHAVLISALALAGNMFKKSLMLFTIGVGLFSFSLYIYSVSGITAFAIITPFGGLSFLAGWLFLVIAAVKKN